MQLPTSLILGLALLAPATAVAESIPAGERVAASAAVSSPAPQFRLTRKGRSTTPGLHVRVLDSAGQPVFPVAISVELDGAAAQRGELGERGFTIPADQRDKVRAVSLKLDGRSGTERFTIDAAGANLFVFEHHRPQAARTIAILSTPPTLASGS